jgi:hypothetical protein
MKQELKKEIINDKSYSLNNPTSYSAEEIFAAGGTTALAVKVGKTYDDLLAKINNAPKVEFADDEWISLLEQVKNDK